MYPSEIEYPVILETSSIMVCKSACKVSAAWTWDSLPSFQDLTAVISNPKDMYAKLGENSNIMPEVEKVLADMQERLSKLQENTDMDSTIQSLKTNIDKLTELFKESREKLQDNNSRFIQGTLMLFRDITKEITQKIQDATSENGKTPREFFTQPQVKSALEMFKDKLEWINQLIEDYMKENKLATESKPRLDAARSKTSNDEARSKTSNTEARSKTSNDEATNKKSWNSRLSFRSKK